MVIDVICGGVCSVSVHCWTDIFEDFKTEAIFFPHKFAIADVKVCDGVKV